MQVDISMTTTDLMEAFSAPVNIVVKCQHGDPNLIRVDRNALKKCQIYCGLYVYISD